MEDDFVLGPPPNGGKVSKAFSAKHTMDSRPKRCRPVNGIAAQIPSLASLSCPLTNGEEPTSEGAGGGRQPKPC
ncbi:hypothetical protein GOBAR_AA17901 [Gossypium barbadense]|uniref:Uncharacterized protein n=1 Tax=Gossypium barbadense TaxID=3634 RepID=A0A2P5XHJ8_GOSBA|nr:hypothetical protein GOBAR_AA17901 [Gossypium barbadense]